jgi:hypothetical protein
MKVWLYAGAFSQPDTAVEFVDDDTEWTEILSEPEVVTDKAKKTAAPAVCGAEFRPGATSKEQSGDNLHWSHALVLDVDYYEHPEASRYPSRAPFTPDELKARMDELGVRYIAFTTWSSSASCWKWRVVVPFSSPMPPTYYGPLWDVLNEHLEGTMSEATRDVGRLGFVKIVNSEGNRDAYRWWIGEGPRLDWSALGLVPESDTTMKRALTPADLTRSPDWSSDAEALQAARRYFKNVGADVEEGNRHETLLRVGCKLWWDWAFNEDQVADKRNRATFQWAASQYLGPTCSFVRAHGALNRPKTALAGHRVQRRRQRTRRRQRWPGWHAQAPIRRTRRQHHRERALQKRVHEEVVVRPLVPTRRARGGEPLVHALVPRVVLHRASLIDSEHASSRAARGARDLRAAGWTRGRSPGTLVHFASARSAGRLDAGNRCEVLRARRNARRRLRAGPRRRRR